MNHDQYLKLIATLNHHANLYYNQDAPEISDYEYDQLLQQAIEFEDANPLLSDPNSPTQKIGGTVLEKFQPFTHPRKLPSLGNVFNKDELDAFGKRVEKALDLPDTPDAPITYTIEPKIDGLAIALYYEKGALKVGATRGDGSTGENVTNNLKAIKSLPQTLSEPVTIEVRGEVYMRKSQFAKLADQFANPRNAAAGTMRQLDSSVVAKRNLDVLIYQGNATHIKSHSEMMDYLKSLGFPVNTDLSTCNSTNALYETAKELETNRDQYDWEIDGAVIKVDRLDYQDMLGMTIKAPRWATAYKFAAEEGSTRLLDITVQVGRTGVLTPVAHLDPIKLTGVTIARATLHNMDEITRLDIQIGDDVTLLRSGDVIPKIIRRAKRNPGSRAFEMPKKCPVCDHEVARVDGEVATKCINIMCPARVKGQLAYFASRNAMDIEGLGESVVDQLVDEGLVVRISDLYTLEKAALLELDRFGEKSAENLLTALEESKTKPLANFLVALGITFVGKHAAQLLADHFENAPAIAATSEETLIEIDGFGEKTAKSVIETFSDPVFLAELERLRNLGLNPQSKRQHDGPLTGKSFLITGTLARMKRHDAEARIKELGGKTASSVNKNLSVLVVGENAGSKLEKAQALIDKGQDIALLNEDEFIALLNQET